MHAASEFWSAKTVNGHVLPKSTMLPLVSALVYQESAAGDCIREVIRSLKDQDYPRLQCIAVLTEPLASAVKKETAHDPRFVIETATEKGAMAAAMRGLDLAEGDFITLLDGSAALFPQFVSMHVQTHLAVSSNAALSVARRQSFRPGIDGGLKSLGRPGTLREARHIPRLPSVPDGAYQSLIPAARMLPPRALSIGWDARPPQMYRRFIVEMMRPDEARGETLAALDVAQHFLPLCHFFGGTIAIDLPLSNDLMPASRSGEIEPEIRDLRRIERLRSCFAHRQKIHTHVGTRLFQILLSALRDEQNNPAKAFARPRVMDFFAGRWPVLVEMFGEEQAVTLFHQAQGAETLRQILNLAYPGRRFSRQRRLLARLEFVQRFRKWIRPRRAR